jgi:hypothetical protein
MFQSAVVSLAALLPACLHAEGIDTEHLFAFMIGADVGTVGDAEFQSETTAASAGTVGAIGRSARSSNWSLCRSRIFESRSEARLHHI